jgi:hypothetical protein
MDKIKETISKFEDFTNTEVGAAVKELEGITTESNRKHLQRLVYVDLINRFDALVDSLLLQFSILDGEFKKKVLNETKDEAIFLKEIYEIFLSEDPKLAVQQRVEAVTQTRFLNQRHSDKLRILLANCFFWKDGELQRPRVFTNNGKIFTETTRLNPYQIPDTVIGYSDWLYSRRNSIVHGDGKKLASKDIEIMKRKFSSNPTSSMRLQLASIKSAQVFYTDLCKNLAISES